MFLMPFEFTLNTPTGGLHVNVIKTTNITVTILVSNTWFSGTRQIVAFPMLFKFTLSTLREHS